MSNRNLLSVLSAIFRDCLVPFSEARTRHMELQNVTLMNKDTKIECYKQNTNGLDNATNSISVTNQSKMKTQYKVPFILYGVSLVFIILGATLGVLWNGLFHDILLHKLVITDTSMSFQTWRKTPVPMYFKIYMFNWTNAGDYGKPDTKPNFEELGPYVFREVDDKLPIRWNDNDTLTFHQKKTWHFEPELSKPYKLEDEIINLNPVAATVAYSFSDQPEFVKTILSKVMKGFDENLTVRRTVGQLLFDGYDDKLLLLALKMEATKLPYPKFGWFYGRNASKYYDGVFNMARGGININEMGTVKNWNYKTKTNFYNDNCNTIEGRIGDIWPPLENNKSISVFASDICTALNLTFDNTTEYLGLTGYRYVADEKTLDNGSKDPSRKCYCATNQCQPPGTLNVAKCKFDAPVFVSMPHFYLADESYRKDIVGMKPNKTKHEFQMAIEPKTGIPLIVKARLQLNLFIRPDKGFEMYKKPMYVPMFWFSQEALLTEDLAGQAKLVIILPLLGHVTLFGICGIGALLVLIASVMVYRTSRNQEDRRDLLKD